MSPQRNVRTAPMTWGAALLLLTTVTINHSAHAQKQLSLGAETSLMASSVWIADALGYFKEEGVDVKVESFGAGRNALETLLGVSDLGRSKVDLATVATTPIVFNSFKNEPYRILMQIAYADDPTRVLVKKASGVMLATDLKGKKLGLQKRTSAHYYFTDLFLSENGIAQKDVELIDINAKDFVDALKRGDLDGVVTWEPHLGNVKTALGADNLLEFSGKTAYQKDFFLVANTDVLTTNLDDVAKLGKALARAETYMQSNREQSQTILARILKMDIATVKSNWNNYHVRSFIDDASLNELKAEADWAVRNKLVDASKTPDYRNLLDMRVMKQLAPQNIAVRDD